MFQLPAHFKHWACSVQSDMLFITSGQSEEICYVLKYYHYTKNKITIKKFVLFIFQEAPLHIDWISYVWIIFALLSGSGKGDHRMLQTKLNNTVKVICFHLESRYSSLKFSYLWFVNMHDNIRYKININIFNLWIPINFHQWEWTFRLGSRSQMRADHLRNYWESAGIFDFLNPFFSVRCTSFTSSFWGNTTITIWKIKMQLDVEVSPPANSKCS